MMNSPMNVVKYLQGKERLLKWLQGVEAFADGQPNYGLICLLLAAVGMIGSTVLSWVSIPLGDSWNGWHLPVDLAWGIKTSGISYGVIGTLMGILLLAAIGRVYMPALAQIVPVIPRELVYLPGIAALVMAAAFADQMIFADMRSVMTFAGQEQQSLLVSSWLSYSLPAQHLPWQPFQDMTSTIQDRASLIFQIAGSGPVILFFSGILANIGAYLFTRSNNDVSYDDVYFYKRLIWGVVGFVAIVLLARAPIANIYLEQSQAQILQGNTALAQRYSTIAQKLNASFSLLPETHYIQGQLDTVSGVQSEDAQIWQAKQYRDSGNAQQSLYILKRYDPSKNEVIQNDTVETLELLAEQNANNLSKVDQSIAQQTPLVEAQHTADILPQMQSTLPWLQAIEQIDPKNLYTYFLQGRIQFASKNYAQSEEYFTQMDLISHNSDVLSIGYTYVALGKGNLGDLINERLLLEKAVSYDHGYYNTVAREAQSGLH